MLLLPLVTARKETLIRTCAMFAAGDTRVLSPPGPVIIVGSSVIKSNGYGRRYSIKGIYQECSVPVQGIEFNRVDAPSVT